MEIFDRNSYINTVNKKTVLALGNFDGVHNGHIHILRKAKEFAEHNGFSFGIYTFADSPKFRNPSHSLLTDIQVRLSFLQYKAQPDFVYLEKFDDVKGMEPDAFVEYIISKFNVCACFCGENFSFGKNASGKSSDLVILMENRGFDAFVVPLLMNDGVPISSTRIRMLLEEGNVEKAHELLGEPYGFVSKVIHGAHLGHTLGFPTVNQVIPKSLVVPKYGVYSTIVIVDGKEYMGVTNFGVKPTVTSDNTPVAETYIIDFDGDVYGKYVCVCFCKMLREEKKFSTLDELIENIKINVEQTKTFFKEKYENK